jgi:hypothetical protein
LDDIEKIADGAAGTNVVPGSLLVLAMLSTVTVLVAFAVTTLVDEPATAVTLVVILLLSVVVDLPWKRSRARPGTARIAAPSSVAQHNLDRDHGHSEHGGHSREAPRAVAVS